MSTSAALRGRKLYLLLLAEPGRIATEEMLPSRQVPFIEPMLKASGFREQAMEWSEIIESQRREGFWSEHPADLLRQLDELIETGGLASAIESPPRRSIAENHQIAAGDDLHNAALFLAAFFPRLPVEEFHVLLDYLLDGKTKAVEKTRYALLPEGEGSIQVEHESVSLASIARQRYEELYQNCGLTVVRASQEMVLSTEHRRFVRGPLIEIEPMERAEQVKRELTNRHFLLFAGFAANLIERRLLLDQSPGVANGTIDLIAEMAATGSRYGVEYLAGLLVSPKPESGVNPLVLSRVFLVLRKFLEEPRLRNEVNRLLNELIGTARHPEALDLVKRLRFAAGFDHVAWWKQLLARADSNTRTLTLEENLGHAFPRWPPRAADSPPDRWLDASAGIAGRHDLVRWRQ